MAETKDLQEVRATPAAKKEGARHEIEATRGEIFVAPDVDIYETDGELVLVADVPGVAKEGVELKLEDGVLEVTARRGAEEPKGPVYSEFRPASYYRAFSVSDEVDSEKIEASVKDGVLTVRLPKSPAARPRKIAVKEGLK